MDRMETQKHRNMFRIMTITNLPLMTCMTLISRLGRRDLDKMYYIMIWIKSTTAWVATNELPPTVEEVCSEPFFHLNLVINEFDTKLKSKHVKCR